MLADYIKERFGEEYTAADFLDAYRKGNVQAVACDYGFCTYQLSGDALILLDLYVKMEYRKTDKPWALFDLIKKIASDEGKTSIITMSNKKGINRHLGLSGIKRAGFKHYLELKEADMFIRGVH